MATRGGFETLRHGVGAEDHRLASQRREFGGRDVERGGGGGE